MGLPVAPSPAAGDLAEAGDPEQDARRVAVAAKIVAARDLPRYSRATRLLEGVSPDSSVYADAQAYLGWIEADLTVREAERAYADGDSERAFRFLSEALRCEALGPEARASVRERRARWGEVVRRFELGMRAYREGRTEEARAELERVLELEPDPQNRFRQLARDQLQPPVTTFEAPDVDDLLREAAEDFRRGRHRDVLLGLTRLEARHPDAVAAGELDAFRRRVVEQAARERWVAEYYADVAADRMERFLDHYYRLQLLLACLDAEDPRRPRAEEASDAVRQPLNAILERRRREDR